LAKESAKKRLKRRAFGAWLEASNDSTRLIGEELYGDNGLKGVSEAIGRGRANLVFDREMGRPSDWDAIRTMFSGGFSLGILLRERRRLTAPKSHPKKLTKN
jgi:hypothetical protein